MLKIVEAAGRSNSVYAFEMGTVLGCIPLLQEKKAEEEVQLDALQVAVNVVLSFVSVVEWRPPGKELKEPCPSCRLESYVDMTSKCIYTRSTIHSVLHLVERCWEMFITNLPKKYATGAFRQAHQERPGNTIFLADMFLMQILRSLGPSPRVTFKALVSLFRCSDAAS